MGDAKQLSQNPGNDPHKDALLMGGTQQKSVLCDGQWVMAPAVKPNIDARPKPAPQSQSELRQQPPYPVDSKLHESVGIEPVGRELEHKVHVLVCRALGLDDEDHEDDELAEPLENALMQLFATHLQAAVRDKDNEITKLRGDIAYAIGRFQGIEMDSAYLEQEYPEMMQYTGLKDKNNVEIYEGDK